MMPDNRDIPGSFRDPSGFVFFQDDIIYRQLNNTYKEHYDHLISSGLYKKLEETGLLIPHEEVSNDYARTEDAYKILQPKLIPFISYPYEWSFSHKIVIPANAGIQNIYIDSCFRRNNFNSKVIYEAVH